MVQLVVLLDTLSLATTVPTAARLAKGMIDLIAPAPNAQQAIILMPAIVWLVKNARIIPTALQAQKAA